MFSVTKFRAIVDLKQRAIRDALQWAATRDDCRALLADLAALLECERDDLGRSDDGRALTREIEE